MNIDELSPHFQNQAKIYALQTMMAALLVRHLRNSLDIDDEAKTLLDSTMGSIAKFDLRGDNTETDVDAARALMEAFAMDTISSAAQSAHLRK